MGLLSKIAKLLSKLKFKFKGGILTGDAIAKAISDGSVKISGFDLRNLNPNSYNLSIDNEITMYRNIEVIDLMDTSSFGVVTKIPIPADGIVLRPGNLYLIKTKESVGSDKYEPIITGRSSVGRLGLSVHQEAGFADIGYYGRLTLQIKVTYPTRIYPGLPIAQVYFLTPYGDIKALYSGKYQGGDVSESMWGE